MATKNVQNTTTTSIPLATGDCVVIVKGCKAREVGKGMSAFVTVTPLGPEYSYFVRVTLRFFGKLGKTLVFYARHVNRLSDPVIRMNDGDPLHVIEVRRA